ncbi:MAG: glycosyltransferase, partial [Rhodothermaceae bacterium]|nr:glycosyltransferase [Rhodothermaceae bacterium]
MGATRTSRDRLSALAAVQKRPISGNAGRAGMGVVLGIRYEVRDARNAKGSKPRGERVRLVCRPRPARPMLLVLFAAALAVQLAYWALLGAGFARVRRAQPEPVDATASDLPFSVIVAARNEEGDLPALLNALAQQTYAPFEVVIADDGSTDGTAALVEARAADWHASGGPALHLVRVPEGEAAAAGLPRKKHALTRAIAAASRDRLAFTDADCIPPPAWIETLAHHAAPNGSDEGAVLIGYGPYRKHAGWLNAFVRYETLVTALMT